jgi:phosphohistidine phosphatase
MSTMRVVLFRHGPAGERDAARWPDDQLRPLTERGQDRTRLAARGLARLNGRARAIWTSPLIRAAQTAEALRDAFKLDDVHVAEPLKPGGSWREMIEHLQRSRVAAGTIVLVGHEPDLGKFAAASCSARRARCRSRRRARARSTSMDRSRPAAGGSMWLLTPKLLRSLARKARKAKSGKTKSENVS